MAARRAPVGRGERAADFVARRGDGRPVRFYGYVGGRPAVLLFDGGGDPAVLGDVRARLLEELGSELDVHAVARSDSPTVEAFHDPEGAVHRAYGVPVDDGPVLVALDPNVRVVGAHPADDASAAVAWAADAVAAVRHTGDGVLARRQAPVLFVPDALDPGLCARLIGVWTTSGAIETGVEATVGDERVEQTDELRKRRRDHTVTDRDLQQTLSSHIGRRVMPEVRKAFAYEATRFEGFKIGCYEAADRGFFTAHRDNLSPATAHRRFGLTLNLNDDYSGGELRFPEYGPDRYRPDVGEALVFSGSHLHEVLPVTGGRRFVLLSFLFGDEHRAT